MAIKKVCCVGSGFVCGTFASILALKCPDITVHMIDKDEDKVKQWNSDKIPIYEPYLEEIIMVCRGRNLFITTDSTPLKTADIIFVCVEADARLPEPTGMEALENAVRLIVNTVDTSKIIVEKSTIPIKAANRMKKILKAHSDARKTFTLITNPEFLTQGHAVNDVFNPDRVLIGGNDTARNVDAVEALISIYERWVPRSKIITSDMWSAELSNLAEVALLAQSITAINTIAEVSEVINADISEVVEAVAMDPATGLRDMKRFVGFGRANFVKIIETIIYLSESLFLPEVAAYWQKLLDVNEHQKLKFVKRIMEAFCQAPKNKSVAVLGYSFKSSKDSAAIFISKALLREGAKLKICDPFVPEEIILKDLENVLEGFRLTETLPEMVKVVKDPYEAAKETEAIVFCTEWPQLEQLDFFRIFKSMSKPAYVFDGSNVLPHKKLKEIGFQVQTLGKNLELLYSAEDFEV